jgi:hypothetical protein
MKYLYKFIVLAVLVMGLSLSVFAKTTMIVEVNTDLPIEEVEFFIQVYSSALSDNERVLNNPSNYTLTELLIHEDEYLYNSAMLQLYRAKYNKYLAELDEKWREKSEQYPNATAIWRFLTEKLGYNDIVSAGIMGNIMVECGGHDFTINPSLYDSRYNYYYGLCQWGGERRYNLFEIYGKSPTIEEQLTFMDDELHSRVDGAYIQNYMLKYIMNASTPSDCAYYFAEYFERCNKGSYGFRMSCAERAYNFFADK